MTEQNRWSLHDRANGKNETFYIDPDSGYRVFTSYGLKQRGHCCGSGCRHCPYEHRAVSVHARPRLAQRPSWLTQSQHNLDEPIDVLFWSGGKDSFLTYRALERERVRSIVLLTTYDAHSRHVAHQDVSIELIARQAEALDLPLIGIPLHSGREYIEQIADGLTLLKRIDRLVFGDLHLRHIRDWREDAFAELTERLQAELAFPLWGVSYDILIDDLEASGVFCEVSAVTDTAQARVRVGDTFDRELMRRLPPSVDKFGERGEFHSLAKIWEKR